MTIPENCLLVFGSSFFASFFACLIFSAGAVADLRFGRFCLTSSSEVVSFEDDKVELSCELGWYKARLRDFRRSLLSIVWCALVEGWDGDDVEPDAVEEGAVLQSSSRRLLLGIVCDDVVLIFVRILLRVAHEISCHEILDCHIEHTAANLEKLGHHFVHGV